MANAPVYGCAMHNAIGRGDLDEMRSLLEEGKDHLRAYGNVALTLEILK